MQKFLEEMKARRIEEGIEEENPFKVRGQSLVDKKLEELYNKAPEGQAGVYDDAKIHEILAKV